MLENEATLEIQHLIRDFKPQDGDLLGALAAAARGELAGVSLTQADSAAMTVVLAAAGYPGSDDRGSPIDGLDRAEAEGALVFHAGTALQAGRVVTNGGRVLAVTGRGETVAAARGVAYAAAGQISFPGVRHRTDVALGV